MLRFLIPLLLLSGCAMNLDPIQARFPPCGGLSECVVVDGRMTITVHDGMNPPITIPGETVYGYSKWNFPAGKCEVWLAPGTGLSTWLHELRHCREGDWHG